MANWPWISGTLGAERHLFGEVTMGVCKQELESRWLLLDKVLVAVAAAKPPAPGYCEVPPRSPKFLPFPVAGLNWFPILEAE